MIARLNIAPTKTNLLKLKRQVAFLEEGHTLLERKRDLLTRLVYERLRQYRELRQSAHAAIRVAWHSLAMTQMRTGACAIRQAALGMKPELEVTVLPKLSLGVEYPAVEIHRRPLEPVGLFGTDASFDDTRAQLAEAAIRLARLGEVETALGRLLAEQRKAQKRVNALKYNIIPRYLETIRVIQGNLEEEERNTLFQIKVLRGH
ncbi:MAG: V-type ATP synthase subunit D [Chromatiales bacterium]|nr:V-type ATP synthase subunit D [Gammaproteobacteria bacterium]MCP5351656.1 V-type ATP synthase subunit D [Chromatiales bacterium]